MATKILYQGHGSLRLTTADGRVLYVDPYAGSGYDKPADLILVTHQHEDHNQINLVTKKPSCKKTSPPSGVSASNKSPSKFLGIILSPSL